MNTNNSNQIETIYDPRAISSVLPIRKAAALVAINSNGEVLIVRRGSKVDEFKKTWSLPSTFIDESDKNIAGTIQDKISTWLTVKPKNIQLVGKRMGIRPKWRLLMYLFVADCNEQPRIKTEKYDDFQWVDGFSYFTQFRFEKMGECTKAYLDYISSSKTHV